MDDGARLSVCVALPFVGVVPVHRTNKRCSSKGEVSHDLFEEATPSGRL